MSYNIARYQGFVFEFELLPDPGVGTIEFEADINSIGSRYSPSWQQFMEVGRADPKILYSQYVQEVDLDFNVVATGNDGNKVADVFAKLDNLAKAAAPQYFSGTNSYQGHFLKFSIGDIYLNEIGYVTSLQYQWENDKTSWIDNLPLLTRANLTIVWIGKKMPQSSNKIYNY
jgi:hypothetical protein